jgi:hypothetical protein
MSKYICFTKLKHLIFKNGGRMYYGSSQVPITAYIRILLLCISEKEKKLA